MRNSSPHFYLGIILLSLIFSIKVERCYAGAWTQRKEHYYLRFTGSLFTSRSLYDRNRRLDDYADEGQYTDFSVYGYVEFGLSDFVTFVGSLPYKRASYESSTLERTTSGVGDVYLGIRYLLSDQGVVSSLQAGLKLSTGYETDLDKLDLAPPLGDGQTDFELRVLLGNSFLSYAAYYNFDFGYRVRSGFPVDEIPYRAEVGLNLGRFALLIGQVYGSFSLSEAGSSISRTGGQVSLSPVEDFMKVQSQLTLHITNQVDLAFVYEKVITGRNTSSGKSISLAIALRGVAR